MSANEPTDAEVQAAAAARNADDIPDHVLEGTPLGCCHNCLNRFEYGDPNGQRNTDPCPECGSQNWKKWGYRMPDGEEVRV